MQHLHLHLHTTTKKGKKKNYKATFKKSHLLHNDKINLN